MSIKKCCFAGHGKLYEDADVKMALYNRCEELIIYKNVNCFWVGNYGEFDKLAGETVAKLKQKYPQIKLELVLPYITKDINEYKELYYEKYDDIILADIPENTLPKFKIIKCNQYMVDNCDYMIAFVNCSFGGAASTLSYAKNKNIEIYNLAMQI